MASIEKLPSGRYRVKWRGLDGKWQSSNTFGAKADANAERRRIESELDAGMSTSAADRRLTVGRYVNRPGGWLESRPWRPSTRDAFDSHWRAHLEPRWGDVRLTAVRPTDVQGWVNDLDRAGLAASTVEALYRRLVAIMRAAHADGVIGRQPVAGITLPERPHAGKIHVPTPEQVAKIAAAMSDRYEPLVWTIATLGLRPAEAIGLTVERVDFLRGVAMIDRQMITTTGERPRLAPLKTRRMPSRELPVPQELLDRLAVHLERHPPIEVDAPDHLGGPGRLLFSNNDGRPIRRNGLGFIWQAAAEKAKLPDELRGWHCLRHYAITRLIVAGVNPDYVRQFAGHSTLTETLDTYSGWWPSDADSAREALSGALSDHAHRSAGA